MEYGFGNFLESYAKSFDRQDMEGILSHFNFPCLIIEGHKVTACIKKEDLEELVSRKFRYISSTGIEQNTYYDVKTVISWEDISVIISLDWITENRTGQQISKNHCNYHLLHKDDSFKIVVASLPDEKE